jgi:ATP-binding cassette subfamily F protein 3
MVELTADRLVLVDHGGAVDYPGSIDDYIDFVLGRNQPKAETRSKVSKAGRKAASKARVDAAALKKAAAEAEAASARLASECSALDRQLADAECPQTLNELSQRRVHLAEQLRHAEARWLEVSEQLERLAA